MRQDHRSPFWNALEQARASAYPPGEYVGQESFMRASEIRRLAEHAGIGPAVSVLDLCCGVAGPGRLITTEFACNYLGLDSSSEALAIARQLAGTLPCRFEQAQLPPLPDDHFEVVLLLETMLAFPDKKILLSEVARVLEPGGRFAFTVEEGTPLTTSEQLQMPDADTVWLIEWPQLITLLGQVGLVPTWYEECSGAHYAMASLLLRAFRRHASHIAGQIGAQAFQELITAHDLWADWLGTGRVRKFACIAERPVHAGAGE